ncbi:SirB1 family protein [Thermosporothrix hazakensis]|jgi:regulator of sirC expression with transglutaminase-like and TPR domain|nr:transglutaminase-like domain-containing protein [Thermosporothrix hazakensis]
MTKGFAEESPKERIYREFEAMVRKADASIDLALAALVVATLEFPELDRTQYLQQLDRLAHRVRELVALPPIEEQPTLPLDMDPGELIIALNKVFFEEEGFHGNTEDYFNPENSYLNKVLEERTGIPITLSLLYIEIARRAGLSLDGIGLPYHFVVRCRLPEGFIYIDPFHSGNLLTEQDCIALIQRFARTRVRPQSSWFKPVSRKMLLFRMLNNLKRIYLDSDDFERTLMMSNLLIILRPDDASERRDRGMLHLQLKRYGRALHDLQDYLKLDPEATDREEIQKYLQLIRQTIAMLN